VEGLQTIYTEHVHRSAPAGVQARDLQRTAPIGVRNRLRHTKREHDGLPVGRLEDASGGNSMNRRRRRERFAHIAECDRIRRRPAKRLRGATSRRGGSNWRCSGPPTSAIVLPKIGHDAGPRGRRICAVAQPRTSRGVRHWSTSEESPNRASVTVARIRMGDSAGRYCSPLRGIHVAAVPLFAHGGDPEPFQSVSADRSTQADCSLQSPRHRSFGSRVH
jgi:hypothetical protein